MTGANFHWEVFLRMIFTWGPNFIGIRAFPEPIGSRFPWGLKDGNNSSPKGNFGMKFGAGFIVRRLNAYAKSG